MEDGVLWARQRRRRSRGKGSRATVRRRSAPGSGRATCSRRSTGGRSIRPADVVDDPPRRASAAGADLHGAAHADSQQVLNVSVDADPVGRARPVLRARVGRHLLAACRRGRPAAPSRQPGDAAFLLALGRVLRGAGVLVQRPARRRSTGSSTGATSRRCCCCRRCSCTSRWCSRSGPTAGCAATPARALLPLLYLPALLLGGARVAAMRARRPAGTVFSQRGHARRARRAAVSGGQPARRAWRS